MGQVPEGKHGDGQVAQLKGANERIEGQEARVADLRRRIVDGSYYVDPAKLSAKIVDHHCRTGS
jgi:anti-sigma28 factor (negative regulator of flagellin synthesis)